MTSTVTANALHGIGRWPTPANRSVSDREATNRVGTTGMGRAGEQGALVRKVPAGATSPTAGTKSVVDAYQESRAIPS
jgi:hypothetical protein